MERFSSHGSGDGKGRRLVLEDRSSPPYRPSSTSLLYSAEPGNRRAVLSDLESQELEHDANYHEFEMAPARSSVATHTTATKALSQNQRTSSQDVVRSCDENTWNDINHSAHLRPMNDQGHDQPVHTTLQPIRNNHQQEKEDYNYDDEEIQKDAANEVVALVVHFAIGLFMILFFGSLLVAIFLVSKYGFFTFLIILFLMMTVLTMGYFVSKLMDKDEVLRPVRRKIRRWHAVATAVVIKEIQDFHLDLNEHLLLMNGAATGEGEENGGDDLIYEMMDEDGRLSGQNGGTRTRRGHRSKVFGFLVKPFLKEKNGKRFRFRRKKKTQAQVNDVGVGGENAEIV